MGLDLIVFWILAGLILAAAWAVVNGNDIVHSVVWLSTVFLLTAGLFILAEAERIERSPAGLESAMLPVTPSFSFRDEECDGSLHKLLRTYPLLFVFLTNSSCRQLIY